MDIEIVPTDEQLAHRKLWCDALRSDEYKQCRNTLCEEDTAGGLSYCCLGVGCEVYKKATGNGFWQQRGVMKAFKPSVGEPGAVGNLPKAVAEWLGIGEDGQYGPSVKDDTLIADNDTHGLDFKAIADRIEKVKFVNWEPKW